MPFQSELCLRYPESLGSHRALNYEQALGLLLNAHRMSMTVPFHWTYIDKPPEGALYVVFLLPQQPHFPIDGIRYQDQEQRYTMSAGQGRVRSKRLLSETTFLNPISPL